MYSKTRVPDIIWLILFGILVGPIFNLIETGLFHTLAPLMSILALGIILFEAGINFDVKTLFGSLMKSTILSITSIFSSIVIIGVILSRFFPNDFNLLQAMLLGAMVGGTSTVAVYGIMSSLKSSFNDIYNAQVLLTMESIISDPVCIISSITIIKMIMLPGVTFTSGIMDITYVFLISSMIGFVIGLLWAFLLSFIRGRPFTYIITLAVLFPSYILAEAAIGEGAGAMIALIFGLTISNIKYFLSIFNIEYQINIDYERLRDFHEEITFFIKSFFFVYIGLVVNLSLKFMLIGLGISLLLMIIRFLLVEVIGSIFLSLEEKIVSQYVYASGLPAFVMSQLPLIFDEGGIFFSNPRIYTELAMPIVLGTIIYSAFIGPIMIKRSINDKREN
jgi:cell volume regulation protein A